VTTNKLLKSPNPKPSPRGIGKLQWIGKKNKIIGFIGSIGFISVISFIGFIGLTGFIR
jgi:hypothetical protein